MKKITFLLGMFLSGTTIMAQNGLERIVVEKYYVSDLADSTNAADNLASSPLRIGSVTYRVYADLLPGYKFIQLFGDATHTLKVNTTTDFYNDPNNGSTFSQGTTVNNTKKNTTLIDSWFSVGGVASGKMGVLKSEDTDGSIGNNQSILANNTIEMGIPINGTNAQDGMLPGTPITPNVLGISSELDIFDQTPGDTFAINNGAIAALGGVSGVTASNMILLGQFTTDGVFSFELNLQIATPVSGGSQIYVASNPTNGQLSDTSLIYTSYVQDTTNNGGNVSVNELNNENFKISVYPNPVKDAFIISVKNAESDAQDNFYSIQDVMGKTIINESLTELSTNYSQKVETSSLPNGIYFVNVNINAKTSTFKIIKH